MHFYSILGFQIFLLAANHGGDTKIFSKHILNGVMPPKKPCMQPQKHIRKIYLYGCRGNLNKMKNKKQSVLPLCCYTETLGILETFRYTLFIKFVILV